MTAIDRLGFHVRWKTAEGMRGARIAFLREVSSPGETRKVLVEMVQQARGCVIRLYACSVNATRSLIALDPTSWVLCNVRSNFGHRKVSAIGRCDLATQT